MDHRTTVHGGVLPAVVVFDPKQPKRVTTTDLYVYVHGISIYLYIVSEIFITPTGTVYMRL